jgi:DUF2911 family protein
VYLSTVLALSTVIGVPVTGTTTVLPLNPDTACAARNVPVPGRKSPLDSLTFTLAKQPIKVCYGRPSSRGRVMLGGEHVPYGKLWRTGANEPTIFFAPVPLTVAGLRVTPGVYSLYTVPGPKEWEIIVNRSISQWGEESNYTDKVKAQEVGRAKVKSELLATPVETFTIRAEPSRDKAASLVMEWEKTRVKIPVQAER